MFDNNLTNNQIKNILKTQDIETINSNYFPKLYFKDKKDNVREWEVKLETPDKDTIYVHVKYGLKDGKKIEQTDIIKEGKNIGKSNETTPHQQGFITARTYFNKQLDKNYRETIEEAENNKQFLPMLAENFLKHQDRLVKPFFIQRKLNGIRCITRKTNDDIEFFTKKGKPITSVGHLKDHFIKVLNNGECVDGELYIHGETLQKLVSIIRKSDKTDERIEYHVYDYVSDDPYQKRRHELDRIIKNVSEHSNKVHNVETIESSNIEDVAKYHEIFTGEGYEGVMIRNPHVGYLPGQRTIHLQKFKKFLDDEFEIVEVIERKNGQGVFVCKTENDKKFSVRPKGEDSYREYILENSDQFVGKLLTVTYFEKSNDDIPVFPVGESIRDYE